MKIIRTKNNSGGPAHPRNLGIAESQGSWIAFLDSDDLWGQDKLAIQLKAMSVLGTSASGCSVTTSATSRFFSTFERLTIKNSVLTRKHMFLVNSLAASSLIVSSEIVKSAGEFPVNKSENFYEDYAYWLRIMSYTNVGMVPSGLLVYDVNGSDTRSSKVTSHLEALRNTLSDFYSWQLINPNTGMSRIERCLVRFQLLIARKR